LTYLVALAVENIRHVHPSQKCPCRNSRTSDGDDGREPVNRREKRVVHAVLGHAGTADDKRNTVTAFVQRRLASAEGALITYN
jgi:hypothetical protein